MPQGLDALPSLPHFGDTLANPLSALRDAAREKGDMILVRSGSGLFSHSATCPGVVLAFGADTLRTVLTSPVFAIPRSAAHGLALPAPLVNLNRSLQSMSGNEHDAQRRLVAGAIGVLTAEDRAALLEEVDLVAADWHPTHPQPLLATMRRLTARIACRLIFGAEPGVGETALAYFALRRRAASIAGGPAVPQAALVEAGLRADAAIRRAIVAVRHDPARDCLLARLVGSASGLVTEDQIIAHANVLLISTAEPVAAALIATLIVLHHCKQSMQKVVEWARGPAAEDSPVRNIVLEVLRLLTPNAIMTRVALADATIGPWSLPRETEFLLCPFLSHRQCAPFEAPDAFAPDRWRSVAPGPFHYLPFGAGLHGCIGRSWAINIVMTILQGLFRRVAGLVLLEQNLIDWEITIMLQPDRELWFIPRAPRGAEGSTNLLAGLIDFQTE